MITHPVDEAKVLKPRPADQDDKSWPIFTLKEVEVFSVDRKKRRLEDLWKADLQSPLMIEGTLERLPRRTWKYTLTNSDLSSHRIRIQACTHWSYGQYEDGEIAFWAAGRSGWFEIKPSRAYSNAYTSLRQAIECLYFVSDFYKANAKQWGAKAGQLKCPLATLFSSFAALASHKCPDEESASLRLYAHREVLLFLMSKRLETESWRWTKTEIYKFLSQEESSASASSGSDEGGSERATPLASSPESDSTHMSNSNPRRLAGKGKSALRPKASKHASSKARARSKPEDEDEEMPDAEDESPSLKRRKLSHQAGTERADGDEAEEGREEAQDDDDDDDDDDGEEDARPVRRRRGRPPKHSDALPSPSASEDDEHADSKAQLPLRLRSGRLRANSSATKAASPATPRTTLSLTSTPLPPIGANTPGMSDTFTCPFDGCAHRIYAANSDASRALIREHYDHHADARQRQLDLVVAEERPYLPVGNLMKKIREMAIVARADAGGLAALGGEKLERAGEEDGRVRRRY